MYILFDELKERELFLLKMSVQYLKSHEFIFLWNVYPYERILVRLYGRLSHTAYLQELILFMQSKFTLRA